VLFPEFARFGMALKSMKDWEDERAVQFLLERCSYQLAQASSMDTKVGVSGGGGCA